ncbi:hypothetical protein THAOC_12678, partial [Thalassiosira oceanica]
GCGQCELRSRDGDVHPDRGTEQARPLPCRATLPDRSVHGIRRGSCSFTPGFPPANCGDVQRARRHDGRPTPVGPPDSARSRGMELELDGAAAWKCFVHIAVHAVHTWPDGQPGNEAVHKLD